MTFRPNPEIHVLDYKRVAAMKGKEDYLKELEADEMRHGFRPDSSEARAYHTGFNRELRDCVDAVRSLYASR